MAVCVGASCVVLGRDGGFFRLKVCPRGAGLCTAHPAYWRMALPQ